jgi:protein-L-isoaspartate(D-aspartate) O-methyltransferase
VTEVDEFAQRRAAMVDEQVVARGINDPRVLAAMRAVHREDFVSAAQRGAAYDDAALPIEHGQSISQPYIVAYMAAALGLRGGERVLEIGTGSGYAAAVLAAIAGEVFTIERQPELAALACERLQRSGCRGVHVRCSDGALGWPEAAPFAAISVAAAAPVVPVALEQQLAIGGRLVLPLGPGSEARLVRVTRVAADRWQRESLISVRFVPFLGCRFHG